MTTKVLTAPAYEPISLAEARAWLRLEPDETDNTTILQILIKAMREQAELLTGRAFISRTLRADLPGWPCDGRYGYKIDLDAPPLISVESVKYIATDGTLTTLAASQYDVYTGVEPGYILPAYNVVWPSVRYVPNAVQVSYTAGYPAGSPSDEQGAQSNVPAAVRLWMQTRLATLYENREQIVIGSAVAEIPRDFTDGLLDTLIIGQRMF